MELKSWDELSELEQLQTTYSDFHKDVYGIRSRHHYDWSLERLKEAMESLEDEAEVQFENDRIRQKEAIEDFEENVSKMITMGAGDRETALRWVLDGCFEEFNKDYIERDPSYFNYEFNLPYEYDWKTGTFPKGVYNPITKEVVK